METPSQDDARHIEDSHRQVATPTLSTIEAHDPALGFHALQNCQGLRLVMATSAIAVAPHRGQLGDDVVQDQHALAKSDQSEHANVERLFYHSS